jgi:hypothetical protein
LKIAEATGSKVDNTIKLEMLKREDEAIKLEKKQILDDLAKKAAELAQKVVVTPTEELVMSDKEKLVDKAAILQDTAAKSMFFSIT